jgi:hypothetical protein
MWVSYIDDQYSIVTVKHTTMHVASGALLGLLLRPYSIGTASFAMAFLVLAWEVYEIWVAPVIGHWAVSNAGNTAIDISWALWPFMYVYDASWGWQSWWLACIVPGVLLGRWQRGAASMAFDPATGISSVHGNPNAVAARTDGTLLGAWASAIQWGAGLVGAPTRKDLSHIEPRMPLTGAHVALAAMSTAFMLVLPFVAARDAIPVFASVTCGFALAQPTIAAPAAMRWTHTTYRT